LEPAMLPGYTMLPNILLVKTE